MKFLPCNKGQSGPAAKTFFPCFAGQGFGFEESTVNLQMRELASSGRVCERGLVPTKILVNNLSDILTLKQIKTGYHIQVYIDQL